MEINHIVMGIGFLILVGLGAVYFFAPDLSPTGLVTSTILPPSNSFLSGVKDNIQNIFGDIPQAVVKRKDSAGILLPGGNSILFTNDRKTTEQDVMIILNATHTTLTVFHMYPEFVPNEFTYVPPEQLESEDPYIRELYPNGYYVMPSNVGN